jgi:hypothetical protein
LAVRCQPPENNVVPVVEVEVSRAGGVFVPVVGKMDTGAARTMLTFDTAKALGLTDPTRSASRQGTARTATDEIVPYYVHPLWLRVSEGRQSVLFPLLAAFAERLKRNLFGIDWLDHVCLAFDREAVHLLRD